MISAAVTEIGGRTPGKGPKSENKLPSVFEGTYPHYKSRVECRCTASGCLDSTQPSLRAAKARVVQQFERSYLVDVLKACDGNISLAARTAGKERRSFQRFLRKYNIAIEQFKQPVRKENQSALRNSA